MNRYSLTFLLLTLIGLLPTAQAGELGRLFFTPQQRQQLDMTGNSGDNNAQRNYIIVNGVVQKKGGKRTVWINGTAQAAEQDNDKAPSTATVDVPGKSRPVQLKVGQRLMLDTPASDSDESKPAEKDD